MPAGGADLLAGQPLQQAAAAEPVAAGHQAVRGHNGVLAHRAAHLILQVLAPVALHSAQQPHTQLPGCLLADFKTELRRSYQSIKDISAAGKGAWAGSSLVSAQSTAQYLLGCGGRCSLCGRCRGRRQLIVRWCFRGLALAQKLDVLII